MWLSDLRFGRNCKAQNALFWACETTQFFSALIKSSLLLESLVAFVLICLNQLYTCRDFDQMKATLQKQNKNGERTHRQHIHCVSFTGNNYGVTQKESRFLCDRTNLQESKLGAAGLHGKTSFGWVGWSPLASRNTWTHVGHIRMVKLGTSLSPLSSMEMESSLHPLLRKCSWQRACHLVRSSTSEAISWRPAQSRQSLQTLSNPWLRPSSYQQMSQGIAGSSCQ